MNAYTIIALSVIVTLLLILFDSGEECVTVSTPNTPREVVIGDEVHSIGGGGTTEETVCSEGSP